jgi:aerobic carbon-monoxide dehydrogenase medium subunit
VIPADVRYHRATSVEDALDVLASDEEARPLAGGQSLIPVMKLRVARPSLVVDIGRLELNGIEYPAGTMRIGALATWDDLARARSIPLQAAALADCAAGIGDLQVRNLGTLGGSLAHADPASDMPAVLLALGADVHTRSQSRSRTFAVGDLLVGPFRTSLEPGELITAISVHVPPSGAASAYIALEHPASGFALAGAAAVALPDGTSRIAVTGIAATPLLLENGDDPLAALAAVEVFGDRFAPAEYRRGLAATVARRALEQARARAEEARA